MRKEEIKKEVLNVIENVTDITKEEIHDGDALMDDLDVSSLEVLTIIGDIEDIFDIEVDEIEMREIVTIDDVIDCIYDIVNQ